MPNHQNRQFTSLLLRMITFIGVIVPRRYRARFRQEWQAELEYREAMLAQWNRLNWRSKLELFWRSLGALKDALWLQRERTEDDMFQDLRYGWRMLLKHKGFTIVAVLSLALGIGANTALFSVIDTVLLQSLPVKEPERLALFEWQSGQAFRTNGQRGSYAGTPGERGGPVFRYDSYQKMRQAQAADPNSPLSAFFAHAPIFELTALIGDQAEAVRGEAVSGGYYAGLGVQPIFGRAITEADDNAASQPVVVLSYDYWQERFGSDPAVIGRQMKLNKESFTIIGVTSPDFIGALQNGDRPMVTVPLSCEPLLLGDRTGMPKADKPGFWWLQLMGRLKPGATLEQARASLNGVFQTAALEVMPPPRKETEPVKLEPKDYPHLVVQSGSRGATGFRNLYATTLYILFGVVAAVLLIACANVANLLLARAALREHEITVRVAVGAGRWRLIRQLLTESLLLSAIGGAIGVIFAYWGKNALAAMADKNTRFLPTGIEPTLNWRVLIFTIGVLLLTGLLFGLAPAWRASRPDLTNSIKQGRRASGVVSRLSKGLVIMQVALSLLLMFGAGLFIRTLRNLQQVNIGFNQENLLIFSLQPGQSGYKEDRLLHFYEQLFARFDGLPGVRAATGGRVPLISNHMWNTNILLPGEREKSAADHLTNRQMIRENYFATLEIPFLRGRQFDERDVATAPKAAIVNQTFSRKFFPNDDALGKRVRGSDGKNEMEIVGVVANSKYNSQRREMEPLLYTPWRQEIKDLGEMYFSLRTSGDPNAIIPAIRQVVRELDSNLPISEFKTQEKRSDETLAQERLNARLLSFFGGLALILATIGLSGVLAYSVAQRTNEIGIRMALGAQTVDVLRMIIWQGMKLVLLGLAVGAFAAYGVKKYTASKYLPEGGQWRRQLTNQLYGISGMDPATFIVIAAILSLAAFFACWLPARRAAKIDPLDALRHE